MNRIIGACGLICSDCEAYKATVTNDDELRRTTSKNWSKVYGADILPEHINCLGCMQDSVKIGHCSDCKMRECVVSKGYENCSECDEYPCEMMEEFVKVVPFTQDIILSLK